MSLLRLSRAKLSLNLKYKIIVGSHLGLILRVTAIIGLLILGALGHQAVVVGVLVGGEVA